MVIPTTYSAPSHVELTIRRPSGVMETVTFPHQKQISKSTFAQIVKATKDAGRGDVLSYTNVTREVAIAPEAIAEMQAMSDAENRYNKEHRAVYAAMDAYHEGHRDDDRMDNTPYTKED